MLQTAFAGFPLSHPAGWNTGIESVFILGISHTCLKIRVHGALNGSGIEVKDAQWMQAARIALGSLLNVQFFQMAIKPLSQIHQIDGFSDGGSQVTGVTGSELKEKIIAT